MRAKPAPHRLAGRDPGCLGLIAPPPIMETFFAAAAPMRQPIMSHAVPPAPTAGRVIKKYPNRRLYDTATSSYVTLAEVKQLIMDGTPFTVNDAKTGEDITRSILLQIILEAEAAGAPMFSVPVLANIIRFYGHAMQGAMGTLLERNIQMLMDLQTRMADQSRGMTLEAWKQFLQPQAPFMQGVMGNYAEESRKLMVQMQEQMQKQMLGAFGIKRRDGDG